MKLQQPCDIAERYVTCTQQGQRREKRRIKDVYSCTQEQIQAAITEAMRTLRYSALRQRQTKTRTRGLALHNLQVGLLNTRKQEFQRRLETARFPLDLADFTLGLLLEYVVGFFR